MNLLKYFLIALIWFSPNLGYAQESYDDPLNEMQQGISAEERKSLKVLASESLPENIEKQEISAFLHQRASAAFRLGMYPRAIQLYREALKNHQPKSTTVGSWGGRFRIRNDFGTALLAVGNYGEYLNIWLEYEKEQSQGNLFANHIAQFKLMFARSLFGDVKRAGEALSKANEIFKLLPNTPEWKDQRGGALYLNSMANGLAMQYRGLLRDAERFFRLEVDGAAENLRFRERTEKPNSSALQGARKDLMLAKTHLANNLAQQGKAGEAEYFAKSALDDQIAYFTFNTTSIANTLQLLGVNQATQQNHLEAMRFYDLAYKSLTSADLPLHAPAIGRLLLSIATLLATQSKWKEALQVLETRSTNLAARPGNKLSGARGEPIWALALFQDRKISEASNMAQELINRYGNLQGLDPYYSAQARAVLAMTQSANGDFSLALKNFQGSLSHFLARGGTTSAESNNHLRGFWRRIVLEQHLELLGKLYKQGDASGTIADEAFRIADHARGSSVQEAIASSAVRAQLPDPNLANLVRTSQDALNRIDALNKALARLSNAPAAQRLNQVITDMQTEIGRARKEHAGLQADIQKRFPEFADLVNPRPPGLEALASSLSPSEALVSIYQSEKQAYVWTITREARAFRVLDITRDTVEQSVATLLKAVKFENFSGSMPAFDSALAARIYNDFLKPDEALWKDAKVLNVIANGALAQLPFGMLVQGAPSANYAATPWLIRKAAIAQLPSASAFMALRRVSESKRVRQPFAGFGDPMFSTQVAAGNAQVRNLTVKRTSDPLQEQLEIAAKGGKPTTSGNLPTLADAFNLLSPLPETAIELREIATVLKANPQQDVRLGRAASEKNVKTAKLDDKRVIAFATHGLASGEVTGLDQPALALSNPAITGDKNDDGFLTMDEVLSLKLDADWVILSACNTASADGKSAEAVSGLGRAFFYAGARSLLVSGWAVESQSAMLLTTEMFRQQAASPTLSRAEALQRSMLSLMGQKASLDYSHPAFWAPFTLVGDSGIVAKGN